jgi:hypothetical protein
MFLLISYNDDDMQYGLRIHCITKNIDIAHKLYDDIIESSHVVYTMLRLVQVADDIEDIDGIDIENISAIRYSYYSNKYGGIVHVT